ncbi:hypothetical protein Taro_008703, partial [Colocasia esculenta]|nr:hypothetical protein [Colocasia esculenta]
EAAGTRAAWPARGEAAWGVASAHVCKAADTGAEVAHWCIRSWAVRLPGCDGGVSSSAELADGVRSSDRAEAGSKGARAPIRRPQVIDSSTFEEVEQWSVLCYRLEISRRKLLEPRRHGLLEVKWPGVWPAPMCAEQRMQELRWRASASGAGLCDCLGAMGREQLRGEVRELEILGEFLVLFLLSCKAAEQGRETGCDLGFSEFYCSIFILIDSSTFEEVEQWSVLCYWLEIFRSGVSSCFCVRIGEDDLEGDCNFLI